jgi:hypothetical protein
MAAHAGEVLTASQDGGAFLDKRAQVPPKPALA